jgi:FAD/FMN-containing dehydrogenase
MDAHNQAVSKISRAVARFFALKTPYRIFHGSTNSTRPWHVDHRKVVDISALSNVIKVDKGLRTALVEPNVPMDRLVAATLRHGLVPPVVMEFPGITAGGGYAGTAGESSSFKYGFFDRTINSAEMVLADGEVVEASEKVNSDLFRGAAGALGTLGITTLLELQLVEAKKYVHATYHPYRSVPETIEAIKKAGQDKSLDYVDGIVFSPRHGVVITGKMTDEKPVDKVQTFSYSSDPWYYLHVQGVTEKAAGPVDDYIPLAEYLFRYDRGGFWVGQSAFDYFNFPFNSTTRQFLDDFLHTRMLYKALHASRESTRYFVQDLALPYQSAESFVQYTAKNLNIWPLWLCPILQTSPPTFHPHVASPVGHGPAPGGPTQFLNIGVWGFGPPRPQDFVAANRDMECRLRDEFGGMKWLYAHAYYPENEFWDVYDLDAYEALREKYRAVTLPSVYDKVKVDVQAIMRTAREDWGAWALSIWPVGGLWGLKRAIESGAYLPRTPPWRD